MYRDGTTLVWLSKKQQQKNTAARIYSLLILYQLDLKGVCVILFTSQPNCYVITHRRNTTISDINVIT